MNHQLTLSGQCIGIVAGRRDQTDQGRYDSAVTLGCVGHIGVKEGESSQWPPIGSAHIRLLHNVTKNYEYL